MWEALGENKDGNTFLTLSAWPEYDEAKTVDAFVEIGVQVNGKIRGTVQLPKDCAKEDALAKAKADENVSKFLEGKTLVKEVYVPGRILNFVVK
jgi:leucyl-tRNA synthetase